MINLFGRIRATLESIRMKALILASILALALAAPPTPEPRITVEAPKSRSG